MLLGRAGGLEHIVLWGHVIEKTWKVATARLPGLVQKWGTSRILERYRWMPESSLIPRTTGELLSEMSSFCGLNMARNLGSNPSALWRSGSAPWFGARGGTDEGIGNGWFLYGFYTDPKMSFKSRYPQQTIESTMNQPKNEENVSRYLKEHWIQNWWRVHSLTLQRLCCSILEISVFGSSFTILSKTGCSNELSVDTARQLWEISESTLDPVG